MVLPVDLDRHVEDDVGVVREQPSAREVHVPRLVPRPLEPRGALGRERRDHPRVDDDAALGRAELEGARVIARGDPGAAALVAEHDAEPLERDDPARAGAGFLPERGQIRLVRELEQDLVQDAEDDPPTAAGLRGLARLGRYHQRLASSGSRAAVARGGMCCVKAGRTTISKGLSLLSRAAGRRGAAAPIGGLKTRADLDTVHTPRAGRVRASYRASRSPGEVSWKPDGLHPIHGAHVPAEARRARGAAACYR